MNQSYRYSGETDVFEAIASVQKRYNIDPKRILIRGHSMGGQAWHLGLQHPGFFAALEASAGYTDTHEYAAARLPKEGLPAYQEATLHYYDSQDYAMNAFNIIAVGHGGEDDPQLRASQRIREALTKDGFSFTQETPYRWTTKDLPAVLFLVSPKTGHLWLPDVKAESEAFLRKALVTAGAPQPHVAAAERGIAHRRVLADVGSAGHLADRRSGAGRHRGSAAGRRLDHERLRRADGVATADRPELPEHD